MTHCNKHTSTQSTSESHAVRQSDLAAVAFPGPNAGPRQEMVCGSKSIRPNGRVDFAVDFDVRRNAEDIRGRSRGCWRMWTVALIATLLPSLISATPQQSLDGGSALVEVLSDGTIDTDSDGLMDTVELVLGTDPAWGDTDGDDMPDGYELWEGLDPLEPLDADEDPDRDGVKSLAEFRLGTLPFASDSDGDGFWDGIEVERGTDPLAAWSFPNATRRADVNCDGAVNATDVQMVMNGVLGLRAPVPVNIDYVSNLDASDIQLVINASIGRS